MKKFLIAAAAVAALTGAAGAASAQTYGGAHRPDAAYGGQYRPDGAYGGQYRPDGAYRGGGYGANAINAKQAAVARRIVNAERMGVLTRREARNLRMELGEVAQMERRFRVSRGLDRREAGILNNRLDRLNWLIAAQVREARDGNRYGQGYGGRGYDDRGYDDRYDRH